MSWVKIDGKPILGGIDTQTEIIEQSWIDDRGNDRREVTFSRFDPPFKSQWNENPEWKKELARLCREIRKSKTLVRL